jgi:hypothetical protein
VCDRVKQILPDAELYYVLSLENKLESCRKKLRYFAPSLDIYHDSLIYEKPRYVTSTTRSGNGGRGNVKAGPPRPTSPKLGYNRASMNKETRETPNAGNKKRCYVCNSTNHFANYHSRANATAGSQNHSMKSRALMNIAAKQQSNVTSNAAGAAASSRNDAHSVSPMTSPAGNGGNTGSPRETEIESCEMIAESFISLHNNFVRDDVILTMCVQDDGRKNNVCEVNNNNNLSLGEKDDFKASDLAPLHHVNMQISDGQN